MVPVEGFPVKRSVPEPTISDSERGSSSDFLAFLLHNVPVDQLPIDFATTFAPTTVNFTSPLQPSCHVAYSLDSFLPLESVSALRNCIHLFLELLNFLDR